MHRCVLPSTIWCSVLRSGRLHAEGAETRAAQTIEISGGRRSRDETKEGRPVIGVDLFDPMRLPLQRDIAFKVTDQTLKTIAERKQLRQLTFRSSWQVPDIGRKSLAGCKELQILRLSDCKVND